jgi:putative redox protein
VVAITITYKGALHCEAVHGPSSTTLVTDAPADNGGKAESFSPTDLVATALGTCILTVMGLKANTLGITIDGATACVEKEMASAPRRIGKLTTTIHVPGDLPEAVKRELEHAVHSCPVHHSLSETMDKPIEFVWG